MVPLGMDGSKKNSTFPHKAEDHLDCSCGFGEITEEILLVTKFLGFGEL